MKKPNINDCFSLLDSGYSLMPIAENKVPLMKWEHLRSKPFSKVDFEKAYSNPKTQGIGLITGVNDLEVIDVDTKVLSSQEIKTAFEIDLLAMLSDNLPDFEKKIVVVRTISGGLHLLYRCKKIEGNKKISKRERKDGEKTAPALIESRGTGGYVFMYENFVNLKYSDIQLIDEIERDIIWSVCRSFDCPEPESVIVPKESKPFLVANDLTPWQDFNEKTNVWDLISSEFTIVAQKHDRIIVKRLGAESAHSGYIFLNKNLLYLFSSATQYPAEKALSPFGIYTIQKHNGNFHDAASQLYKDGYGSRLVNQKKDAQFSGNFELISSVVPIEAEKAREIELTSFPLEIYPDFVQNYILSLNEVEKLDPKVTGSVFFWMMSLMIGNRMEIEVFKSWKKSPVIWMALVANRGDMKSPSIDAILSPIYEYDREKRKEFEFNMKVWLSGDKKEDAPPLITKLVDSGTIEGYMKIHRDNQAGIGLIKDELSALAFEMEQDGTKEGFYLSSFNNGKYQKDTKNNGNDYIDRIFFNILGGFQPQKLKSFSNKFSDSGVVDRFLYIPFESDFCDFSLKKPNIETRELYNSNVNIYLQNLEGIPYTSKRYCYQIEGEAIPIYENFVNKLLKRKIDYKGTSPQMYPYMSKILTYYPRFVLIFQFIFDVEINGNLSYSVNPISCERAYKLIDFFINNADSLFISVDVGAEIETFLSTKKYKTKTEKATALLSAISTKEIDIKNADIARHLGLTPQRVSEISKKLKISAK